MTFISTACIEIQGCEGPPSSISCNQILSPDQRIACLDQVMFGRVARGAAIGAIAGAVLGGAVAFAITRGRSFGAIGMGILAGTMVGGVAGGLTAYLSALRERAGGRPDLMRENATAYLSDDTRHLDDLLMAAEESRGKDQAAIASLRLQVDAQRTGLKASWQTIDALTADLEVSRETNSRLAQAVADLKQAAAVHSDAGRDLGLPSEDVNEYQTKIALLQQQVRDKSEALERADRMLAQLQPQS